MTLCVVPWVLPAQSGLIRACSRGEPSVSGNGWGCGLVGLSVGLCSWLVVCAHACVCVMAVVKRDERLDALMDQFDKELEADALKVTPYHI